MATLKTQAKRLGKSKYASFLESLNQRQAANRALYDTSTSQRKAALDRELGSIMAAEATTKKNIGLMKTAAATASQQAVAASQANSAATQAARNQANSNMLSSIEAEAKARGLSSGSGGALSEASMRLGSQDSTMNAVASMNQGSLERMGAMEQGKLNNAELMAAMVSTTAQSGARGAAQGNLDEMYKTYLAERMGIEGERSTKKLEKQDYINQMYLTLKEKKAAEKAAKAQAKMQAAIAQGNLNYKNTKLQVDTQYKYDKLAADTAQKEIANKLKAEGFSHKKAMDIAKKLQADSRFQLDLDKWNWKKANPDKSVGMNASDLIASLR